MGLQRYLGFPESPNSPLNQCVLAMESVTTPAPGQTGALLDLGLQEGFSHGRSCSVLAQAQRSGGAAAPAWAWGQGDLPHRRHGCLSQHIQPHCSSASSSWLTAVEEEGQGGLTALAGADNSVPAGVKGQLWVLLTCPTAGPRQDWSPRHLSLLESMN